tara:strand:- start:557 stop:943 length:387 start_codon:yes stop_codon:yes gene_type:complete
MKKENLPISPHLQIYKPQITSVLSITHRITGFCLNIALFFFTLWLISLSLGKNAYDFFIGIFSSFPARLIFTISIFGFFYHFLNGLRHILWDFGFFLEIRSSTLSGYFVILFSVFLTLLLSFKIGLIL